jgi:lipid-A-disaccharide synthase
LSAGEASGDLQASLLVEALRKTDPGLTFEAVGGSRLRSAGARIVLDSVAAGWASIGHLRAYLKIPWLLAVMLGLAERLLADPPRLLICVDFGAFNLRMLEWLRFRGYRGAAVYYFPPGVWIDDPAQARKVATVATALTPFGHQAEFYRSLGLRIEYFGHPLAGRIAPRAPRPVARPPIIAVMPGSREEEVARHLPILSAAARRLASQDGARFLVIAASDEREREIRAAWPDECGGASAVAQVPVTEATDDADVAWVASGTAVLETALRGVPQIAFYRIGDAQYRIALRRIPHIVRGPITLPNLVTGQAVVPELLQGAFDPDALVEKTRSLLGDDAARGAQAEGFAQLRRMLGPPDALDRIAAFVAGVLAEIPSR